MNTYYYRAEYGRVYFVERDGPDVCGLATVKTSIPAEPVLDPDPFCFDYAVVPGTSLGQVRVVEAPNNQYRLLVTLPGLEDIAWRTGTIMLHKVAGPVIQRIQPD